MITPSQPPITLEPHRELCKVTHLWGRSQSEGKNFKGLELGGHEQWPSRFEFLKRQLSITALQVAMVTSWPELGYIVGTSRI